MYKREHHQRIAKVLEAFDCGVLNRAECFFGGGTAIVLMLDEYRESVDIDFLCSSNEGYRILRNLVSNDLGSLLKWPLKHLREVRADRDAIRTVLEIDGQAIKIEFLKEGNSPVSGEVNAEFGIPTLSHVDMFTQKLLANADRGMDKSSSSRDIIDLAMMIHNWGGIPRASLDKAYDAYGACVQRGVLNAIQLIQDQKYLAACLDRMKMDPALLEVIASACVVAQANVAIGPVVTEGGYSGTVLDVAGGAVTQKVDNKGAMVVHALASLSRVVEKGEVVDIRYAGGVGVVSGMENSVGVGR